MNDVYLNRIEKYLPNEPVSNDEMEERLGLINGKESINRGLILRSNQINKRYYALDQDGKPTHSNAQLTALAVNKLFDDEFQLKDLQLLTTGTSSPDVIQPSHALMVQGELGGHPMEVMAAHGTCNAAMLSLKYAYLAIKTGEAENAVCTGSETFSTWMLAQHFKPEIDKRTDLENNPYVTFEKDFIRWMLSDGAAAVLMQNKPNPNGLSLKLDWIEIVSFANELEACMYAGGEKTDDGNLRGWKEMTPEERDHISVFSLKQDARLLQEHIVNVGAGYMKKMMDKHGITVDDIDYFLPHLSSMFFKKQILTGLSKVGIDIPYDKWFLNLTEVGNVGSASAFLMIEELFHSGKLKKGDRIVTMVPESARFSYSFLMLVVV